MRKLLIVLSILFSVAGCAGTGMSSSMDNNWDRGSLSGAGND